MASVHMTPIAAVSSSRSNSGGPSERELLRSHAAASDDGGLGSRIALLRELHRQHKDLQNASIRLELQVKAIHRRLAGGDHDENATPLDSVAADFAAMRLSDSREMLLPHIRALKRQMEKLAPELPGWEWCQSVRGLGPHSYAQIVAETGNALNYPTVAKVWKRMGLAVIRGERQRRVLDKELAIEMGYDARRRAIMHVIGENLLRCSDPYYRPLYDKRKAFELEKAPDAKPIVHHKRALRYIEKRLLREMWRAWRSATELMSPRVSLPSAPNAVGQ